MRNRKILFSLLSKNPEVVVRDDRDEIHPVEDKEKNDLKVFIYGHTHRYSLKEEDGILWINPGSVSLSRDHSNGSFVILTMERDLIKADVIDIFTKNILSSIQIM